jgi:hypothetical protein
MTSSSGPMRAVELFELQAEEGPCVKCFRTGEPVAVTDLGGADRRWPRFAAVAARAGFHAADAVPMRLRRQVIGALNLFHTGPATLGPPDLIAARSLADVATIAILQHRATMNARAISAQLHEAMTSRIVIEQAKGMVAEHEHIDADAAFARLRAHARNHNQRLADVAGAVTSGRLSPAALATPRPRVGRARAGPAGHR